jgi:hypothetical protein
MRQVLQSASVSRRVVPAATVVGISLVAGCNRAPSISILGSFFPAWLFCLVLGILLTSLVHLGLQHTRLAGALEPPVLVYPSLIAVFTMSLWLLFYS